MNQENQTKSGAGSPDNLLTRRRFFLHSGAAILATNMLTSCSGVLDDLLPKKDKPGLEEPEPPLRDKTLAFFGDSLTIGTGGTRPYGALVGAALSGRTVFSDGIVGQIAQSISIRQGGTPVTITVEGGKFDGTNAVKITKLSNEFLSTPINDNTYSRTGTIADIKCTITRTANSASGESYTITPESTSTTEIPADSVFILDDAVHLKTATQILWYGRNDVGDASAEEKILTALESSIAYITDPKRYLVLGVLLASPDIRGTVKYGQVTEINDTLAARYGKSFVPMTPPTAAELEAIGYTPTSEDNTDLENMNFPRGLRANESTDKIHLNDKGYQIVANRVVTKLKELKY
ncbi:SGNH/GDSL hydrolase family protein [Dyadobacter arcticus]|uniref:Lysophospholipase L1-like esterase n=1 Tax=Dyadobacter arcticus TaxID=1078754 RepID=A0ABX0UR01_9BACT|nr:SGNH/GDSL hydrolase family protein [Dyadobacter arcticus]NIJ55412.1 lysophospholipase L1-like esterase [Dyadobacter arcticus]